jgi:glycosyltransferase involved in cell wall biosynthesis
MRIVAVYKSDPAFSPPLSAACRWLAAIGCDVALVCVDPSDVVRAELERAGIAVHALPGRTDVKGNLAARAVRWVRFSTSAWRVLSELLGRDGVLWAGGLETAVALGRRLFERRYVLQMHELYDREWRYRVFLPRLIRGAEIVVVPEAHRADLIRLWYRPRVAPVFIPNKPFSAVRPVNSEAHGDGRRMMLYQGLIDLRERDLLPAARAFRRLRDEWRLVFLGHDLRHSMRRIREVNPDADHLPFVPPPLHSTYTAMADAGLVAYSWSSLNTAYCAPNKIWENAAYGKPMLCNDVPGLTATVGRYQAGLCVDFRDEDAIVSAVRRLDREHLAFERGARRLYASFDAESAFRDLLVRLAPAESRALGVAV